MFDIKWIRDNADAFDEGLKRRGLEAQAAEIIALDDKRRACLTALQDAQSRRNAASKEIGKAKAAKDDATVSNLMGEVAELKDRIAKGENEERKLDAEIRETLEVIPNLPRADVPDGADEKSNVEARRVGTPRKFDFAPKQHFEIGEALGLMDFEAAQKISGARFVVLKGALARLERAIGSSCSICTRASLVTRKSTRLCWSRIKPLTAPAICRSLPKIFSRRRMIFGSSRPPKYR